VIPKVPDMEQLLCLHLLGVLLMLCNLVRVLRGTALYFQGQKNNLLNFNGNLFLSISKTIKE